MKLISLREMELYELNKPYKLNELHKPPQTQKVSFSEIILE